MDNQARSLQHGYLEEVNNSLDILWDTANRIVQQVLCFRPDVVVCLMHSGRVPLEAALRLWEATQTEAFPTVVKTNLGREKLQFYQDNRTPFGHRHLEGNYSEPFQIGHFLAWLKKQSAWQAELKAQIQDQLGTEDAPQKIMIVDDWIAEGNTYLLVLGLMEIIYPVAETNFVAGVLGWKAQYDRLWLKLFHPSLHEKIQMARDEEGARDGEMQALLSNTTRLMLGTEDIWPENLDWRPITAASPMFQKLSQHLAVEEWLDLPQFVNKTIEDYLGVRIHEYRRGKIGATLRENLTQGSFFPKLSLDVLVLRDLWLNEAGITRRQIMEKYHLTAPRAARLLRKMVRQGLLAKAGHGRGSFYFLPPDAHLEFNNKARSPLETYWVAPSRFLVGDSLHYLPKADLRAALERLNDQGVDFIFDLNGIDDAELGEFEGTIQEEAAALGINAIYRWLDLPTARPPGRALIKKALDAIDQALAGGYTVFAGYGTGEQMNAMIAGCYLARHGLAGRQALKEVERLRSQTTYWWRPAPARESQRRLVRGWRAGE